MATEPTNPRLVWHDHYLIVQEKGEAGAEDQIYVIPYQALAQYKQTGELADALRGRSLIRDFFSDSHMQAYAAKVEAVLTKAESQSDGASVADLPE